MKQHKLKNRLMVFMLSLIMVVGNTSVNIVKADDPTVYITPTGSKYHTHECGAGDYYPCKLSEAKAIGLEPCKKCYGESGSPSQQSTTSTQRATTTPQRTTTTVKQDTPQKVTVTKLDNPLKVKGNKVIIKYARLKKKPWKIWITKAVTFKNKGQGQLTYTKVSGSSKIQISNVSKKIKVKKGLAKGKYKIKMKIQSAGNDKYKPATKQVTFLIKII